MTEPSNRGLWIGLAFGGPVLAFGLWGAVHDGDRTHPAELARWVVGAALVHDVLLVPAVLGVAWLLRRVIPYRAWPTIRWALVTSAVLVAFSWPFVRGYGRDPTIPSLLNRNYAVGLAVYVIVVWVIASAVACWRGVPGSHVGLGQGRGPGVGRDGRDGSGSAPSLPAAPPGDGG